MCRAYKAQALSYIRVVRYFLSDYIHSARKRVLCRFNALFLVYVVGGQCYRLRCRGALLINQFCQGFKPFFLCNARPRFALFLVGSVNIVKLGQGLCAIDCGGYFLRQSALLLYRRLYLFPRFVHIAQVFKPFVKLTQDLVIKRACGLLAVARDKGYCVALVYQLYRVFNLKGFKRKFLC